MDHGWIINRCGWNINRHRTPYTVEPLPQGVRAVLAKPTTTLPIRLRPRSDGVTPVGNHRR